MKITAIQVLLVFFFLFQSAAKAETIYLKDGSTVSGKIKVVGNKEVIINTVLGDMTIESEKILKLGEEAPKKAYSEFRVQQNNGLGFGPAISTMLGFNLFYDHNFSSKSQMHIQLSENVSSMRTSLGIQVMSTERSMVLATYRYFFSENKGFYMGAGGGYAHSKLNYSFASTSGAAPTQYDSRLDGVFVLGELGWQGIEGYYFSVGLQPAVYVSSNDNFDINKIPNISNHQSAARTEHNNLSQLTQLSLGFGWFF